MNLFRILSTLAVSLVAATSGCVSLILTYGLVKAAVAEPRSFDYFEALFRHYTDRLVVNPDGTGAIMENPHPILSVMAFWMVDVVIFVAAVYALHKNSRAHKSPRLELSSTGHG